MESREARKLKKMFSIAAKLKRGRPVREGEQMFGRHIPARERSIPDASPEKWENESFARVRSQNIPLSQVKKEASQFVKRVETYYKEKDKKKAVRNAEAKKQWAIQRSPQYQLEQCATYGWGGSFIGQSGSSKTGKRLFKECKKLPKSEWVKFIKNLQEGVRVGPLKDYNQSYINDTIQWATSVVLTMD